MTDNIKLDVIFPLAIRMALIGLLGATFKNYFNDSMRSIYEAIWPTAYITQSDPAFNWITTYLAQSAEAQKQMKSFRLTTSDLRHSKKEEFNRLRTSSNKSKTDSIGIARNDATFVGEAIGQMSLLNDHYVRIKHKGTYLWVERSSKGLANRWAVRIEDHYRIVACWFQAAHGIKQFITDAHELYHKKSDDELIIFNLSPATGNWIDPIHRPSRLWSSVILPITSKEPLLQDVKNFLSEKEKRWYNTRGIPHRRGYLLHGKPGSGKTTLATAVASQLGLDIYIVNPAARGMDDAKLNKAFRNCPAGNMILLEDLDCVMPHRNQTDNDDDDFIDTPAKKDTNESGKNALSKSTVTLSGLLNAIDGVSSQEDCILFATTNHPERLDPALSRAGRFDVQIAFEDATFDQAKLLYKHFYPSSDFGKEVDEDAELSSTVDVEFSETTELIGEKLQEQGTRKSTNRMASEEQLDGLAEQFAQGIFNATNGSKVEADVKSESEPELDIDLGISMAALQNYLLTHKDNPHSAATKASDWSTSLRIEMEQKERKRLLRKAERSKVRVPETD
ncbi:uncharacterized protein L201_002024 [Kwoniella dendrophila CBS 6074]|uniref:AAA+ ATPase domain-containing protein n=1 Tax=Kwoniella dendrophila CBS 6074 TaxID=1295534 RepID=A0AAX4JQJ6_9TREE